MLQSWDNVAKYAVIHSKLTYSEKIYLPSCTTIVSIVRRQLELWTYYFVDHTPQCWLTAAAQTNHCNGDVLALFERQIYHQTMTKNKPRLSLRSRLSWPLKYVYM